jgi:hypothetical protein
VKSLSWPLPSREGDFFPATLTGAPRFDAKRPARFFGRRQNDNLFRGFGIGLRPLWEWGCGGGGGAVSQGVMKLKNLARAARRRLRWDQGSEAPAEADLAAAFAARLRAAEGEAGAVGGAANPLWDYFQANRTGPGIWKWVHYFEIYHRRLAKFVGRRLGELTWGANECHGWIARRIWM